MKSIMQQTNECYICGCKQNLEEHHVMSGTANRRLSERYGLKVYLCYTHHRSPIGVHNDYILKERLEKDAQIAFEKIYGHSKWMQDFRKNYL